jgi:Tol biopolymer transport system component
VIALGSVPFWSPDGSRIAYTIRCDPDPSYSCGGFGAKANPPGLAIADADGSNVKEFGYGASGPWFPLADPSSLPTGVSSSEQARG